MPNPRVEFELDDQLPLGVRNTTLEFTDRWRGFETDVFRLMLKLTSTLWKLAKIRVRFQSTLTPESEPAEGRATVELNVGAGWKLQDYLEAVIRELILANQKDRVRRQLKSPLDEAAYLLISDAYARNILGKLYAGTAVDLRPSVTRFLSIVLPAKYPAADRERLLEEAPRVRGAVESILGEFTLESGQFYVAFLKLRERLDEELSSVLTPNL